MTTMKNYSSVLRLWFVPVLLGILALTGCREGEPRAIDAEFSSQLVTERNSDVCFTSLDRHATPSLQTQYPPPEGMVLAGFVSNWFPGADPIPCNRFKRAEVSAQFTFSDRGLFDPRIQLALLELVEFQPAPGSVNVDGRTTCTFNIFSKRDPHATRSHFFRRGEVDPMAGATALASHPRPIVVPNGAGHWSAVVTDEILQTSRSPADIAANTVFVLSSVDPALNADQSNSCAGYFRFRLRVFF